MARSSYRPSGRQPPPDELYRTPRWYACYTSSRQEKKVDELLRRRGFESFLPLIPRQRQWSDRKQTVLWPMFPSYVFARFALRDYHAILTTPGVATVVRSNGYPVAVSEAELDNVRALAQVLAETGIEAILRPMIRKGQRIRVIDGPFRGIEGIVVQIRGKKRVLVGVQAVNQALQLDLDMSILRPIPERP